MVRRGGRNLEELHLELVHPANVEDIWPVVGPWILNAVGPLADASDVAQIKNQAVCGNSNIIILRKNRNIELVLVTEACFYGGRKTLVLRWMSGKMENHYLSWIFMLENYALKAGFERLEVWGRKGWERKLKPYGLAHEYTVLGKHLPQRAH